MPDFSVGDRVVLFAGTRVGSPGSFVALRPDPAWGDVRDPDGTVAAHPMQWVRHWREGHELPNTIAAFARNISPAGRPQEL
ncbi:hypothetical protein [Nevskia soli]|jgi:hypothetical protein|uniref:hypothetical protein n=1 Tax=Nevskia soli TaxID=418856 RepID=UPI0015D8703E|nr:hypothetical protein [Nevskia soli]